MPDLMIPNVVYWSGPLDGHFYFCYFDDCILFDALTTGRLAPSECLWLAPDGPAFQGNPFNLPE